MQNKALQLYYNINKPTDIETNTLHSLADLQKKIKQNVIKLNTNGMLRGYKVPIDIQGAMIK